MSAAPVPDPPAGRRAPLWWRRFRLLPRPIRISTYVVGAVVLAMVAATLAGVVVVRRSWPQTTGTLELPGLGAAVDVVRDEVGVPQVYADTPDDLFRAQGYLAAQDRFFEMDVRRHATAGRLAELVGAEALESDLLVRTMGWRRVAERELPLLEPSTRAALDSYAAGVNAWLEARPLSRMSLEYAVLDAGGLDYRPEPWTPVDSLAWLKAMAWDLRGNMVDEVDRALVTAAVGARRAGQLWPAYPYRENAPIVRQGAVVDGVFEQDAVRDDTRNPVRPPPFGAAATGALTGVRRSVEAMPAWLGRGDGIGSNSLVVAGEHTDTGQPLLANDPHLGVSLPGVWLQVGLHCRTLSEVCPYDVAGFSFSGVPGVIIGHNADIAWGFTNLGPDVTDLYVERIVGDRWRRGGRSRPLTTRTERFEVAGGDPIEVSVRATGHGPIVSDADVQLAAAGLARGETLGVAAATEGDPPGAGGAGAGAGGREIAVSLAWTALQPGRTADAILALDRARDWDTFRAAVSTFDAPAQNIVYADREGHIGYQAPGRVPIRESGNTGRTPSAGWRTDTDWTGEEVPYDGLPSVLDPREGFVVTANQAVTGPRYPYFLTDDWDHGYRSQRIRTLLAEELDTGPEAAGDGTVSAEDLLRIQRDASNPLAPSLVPLLLEIELAPAYDDDGQQLLVDWDHSQPAESAAAAYFNAVWRELLRLTFHDELPVEQWPDGGQRWMAAVTELLQRPGDPWWDDVSTEEREDRDDLLEQALLEARDVLTSEISPDPAQWSWGQLHRLELRNQTLGQSGIAGVARLFNRGGWEASGGGATVNATGWDAAEGYQVVTAPSMRMVVDLGDLDASRWVALGGVSGHAFHPHYTDQTDLLIAGETLPWPFSRDAVEAAGEDRLTLVPPEPG